MSQHERDVIIDGILAREPRIFRSLGSAATEAAAASWKWEVVEASIRVQGSVDRVAQIVEDSIGRIGSPQPDSDGASTLIVTRWAGVRALVTVTPGSESSGSGVLLNVRSVSGEGMISRHGARKAFELLVADLRTEASLMIDSVRFTVQRRSGKAPAHTRAWNVFSSGVLLLWTGTILVRVFAGRSLAWLASVLFFAGLALGVAFIPLRRQSQRGEDGKRPT